MNHRDADIRGPVILRRLYCKIVCRLVPPHPCFVRFPPLVSAKSIFPVRDRPRY